MANQHKKGVMTPKEETAQDDVASSIAAIAVKNRSHSGCRWWFYSKDEAAQPVGAACSRDDSVASSIAAIAVKNRSHSGCRWWFHRKQLRRMQAWPLVALLLLGLAGCSKDSGQGPLEVRWDRVGCDRCRMVLSDPMHSAQVRHPNPKGEGTRVSFFDDIGCAVIWLAEQPFASDPGVEIWVNHWQTGDWIDARQAVYLTDQQTPMGYGLGAQQEAVSGGLNFTQAQAHILEVEQRFNIHGGNLSHPAHGEDH